MSLVQIKRGDTRPLDAVIRANKVAVPLAGATVRFLMKPRKIGQGSIVDAPATITDAPTGKVRYAWAPTDVDTPGLHRAEFEVTFADTTIETFPNGSWIDVEILADLD